MLRRKNIRYVIYNKFKQVSVYRFVRNSYGIAVRLSKEDKVFIKGIFHVNVLNISIDEKHIPKTI